jgi:hypothetical protein
MVAGASGSDEDGQDGEEPRHAYSDRHASRMVPGARPVSGVRRGAHV